jgi:hypothetical protein
MVRTKRKRENVEVREGRRGERKRKGEGAGCHKKTGIFILTTV